jgi:hypothetical protein
MLLKAHPSLPDYVDITPGAGLLEKLKKVLDYERQRKELGLDGTPTGHHRDSFRRLLKALSDPDSSLSKLLHANKLSYNCAPNWRKGAFVQHKDQALQLTAFYSRGVQKMDAHKTILKDIEGERLLKLGCTHQQLSNSRSDSIYKLGGWQQSATCGSGNAHNSNADEDLHCCLVRYSALQPIATTPAAHCAAGKNSSSTKATHSLGCGSQLTIVHAPMPLYAGLSVINDRDGSALVKASSVEQLWELHLSLQIHLDAAGAEIRFEIRNILPFTDVARPLHTVCGILQQPYLLPDSGWQQQRYKLEAMACDGSFLAFCSGSKPSPDSGFITLALPSMKDVDEFQAGGTGMLKQMVQQANTCPHVMHTARTNAIATCTGPVPSSVAACHDTDRNTAGSTSSSDHRGNTATHIDAGSHAQATLPQSRHTTHVHYASCSCSTRNNASHHTLNIHNMLPTNMLSSSHSHTQHTHHHCTCLLLLCFQQDKGGYRDAEGRLLLKLATQEEAEAAQSSFRGANYSKYAVIFKIPEGADPEAAINAVMKGVGFAVTAADIFPIFNSSYGKGYRLTCPSEDVFFATLGKIIRVPGIEDCETAVVLVGSNRSLVGATSHLDKNVGEHARQAHAAGVPYAQMFPQFALSGGSGPQGNKAAKAGSSKAAEAAGKTAAAAAAKDTAGKQREGRGSDQDVTMADAPLLLLQELLHQASNGNRQQCSFLLCGSTNACSCVSNGTESAGRISDLSLSNTSRVCKAAAAASNNIFAIMVTSPMHAEAELRNMLHLPRASLTAVLPLPPHCCCRSSRRRAPTEYWACGAPLPSATACTTPAPCDGAVTSVVQLLCWHAPNSNCGTCCAAAAADCSSASMCESYARCCAITRDHVGTYGSMECRGRVYLYVFMLERCCNVTHHVNWHRVQPAGQGRKWDGAVETLNGGKSQQRVTCCEIMNPSCSHVAVHTCMYEQQALAFDCGLRHLWVACSLRFVTL